MRVMHPVRTARQDPPGERKSGVRPVVAARFAAASEDDEGLTSTEWGWVLFGVLAAAVLIGGLVLWLRRRSAAKRGEGKGPPPADLTV